MAENNDGWVQKIRTTQDHREFVGPSEEYDVSAAVQFNLLTFLGLRENHNLLDIGCGALRGGRLFIIYLLPEHYFGIEPEEWLIERAIISEIGKDLISLKKPSFNHDSDFRCELFNRKFDYLLAQGVFTHAPEWQIRNCMLAARQCMKSDSLFVASYNEDVRNYTGDDWRYPGITTFTSSRMKEMASDADLNCLPIDWPHPHGHKWIVLCRFQGMNKAFDLVDRSKTHHSWVSLDNSQVKLRRAEELLSKLKSNPCIRLSSRISSILKRILK